MTYLTATAGITGVLCCVNLLLALLLIRRVKDHDEQLARRGSGTAGLTSIPAGGRAPSLNVPTVSGRTYSLDSSDGSRRLVAFLAPGCTACHRQLPELREYARTFPGGASQILAVVRTDDEVIAADLARDLTGWASVTLEPPRGATQKAFSVSRYPMFYTLAGDGKIEAGAMTVQHLAAAVAQPTGQS